MQPGDGQDLHRLDYGHRDGDQVRGGGRGPGGAYTGQVGVGVGDSLGGVEGEVAVLPVDGQVDGLDVRCP